MKNLSEFTRGCLDLGGKGAVKVLNSRNRTKELTAHGQQGLERLDNKDLPRKHEAWYNQ